MSRPGPPTDRHRADPDDFPGHTAPTWEVELLISGLAVFAMLQLPGWLDNKWSVLDPRFDAHWADALLYLIVFLKLAAVTLAITFSIHLLLRAQWIALVGMHSVYPDGVLWEKLRMGPLRRATEKHYYRSTSITIERADNRATTVFAMGVMVASMMLAFGLLAGLVFAITLAIAAVTGTEIIPVQIFAALTLLLLVPFFALQLLDRLFGDRLPKGRRLHRILAGMMNFYTRLGLGRGSHAMALIYSHGGERRVAVGLLLALMVTGIAMAASMRIPGNPQLVGNYALFPHPGSHSGLVIESAHYDDQRDLIHDAALPYIQSAIISGPYVQLIVPYRPRRDTPALRNQCPEALALPDKDARGSATLACLSRLHTASLDGEPLTALRYDISSDSRTDRPALQAMIDVRTLAPGRHVLRVTNPQHTRQLDDDKTADTTTVIPFWR